MTAKYFAILTNYGAAQLANAVALGTQMNITAMGAGDGGGTLPVPDPAQTTLIRENRRAAVNQVSVDDKNPNIIIAEQVIPENEGGWWIREIGLYDDNGGLIAVGNAPETYKPNLQEGSGRTQVLQMALIVSSTQAVTLKVDPSVVLATREYVTKSIDAAIQASEARAAKTYQPIGDYVLHPYLKLELLKKIDKADIAQQLGNDTGKVVSQNLLTTELGKKASIADANSKLAKDQNGADIPNKDTFIKNLGLPEKYQPVGYSYSKTEADKRYQPKGDYADTSSEFVQLFSGDVQSLKQVGVYSKEKNHTLLLRFAAGVPYLSFHDGSDFKNLKHPGKSGTIAVNEDSLGMTQRWVNVKGNRVVGATYTNESGRPICIFVRLGMATSLQSTQIIVDGLTVGLWTGSVTSSNISQGAVAIVPPGSTYRVVALNGVDGIQDWVELR